jgi:hypothetical protein
MLARVILVLGSTVVVCVGLICCASLYSAEGCSRESSVGVGESQSRHEDIGNQPIRAGNSTPTSGTGHPTPRILPPRTESPHWDHIAISDFARGYYWSSEPTKDRDRQWLAARVDLIEGKSARDPYTEAMRECNPTLAVFQYRLDHYDFVNDQSRALHESRVLHVGAPTTLKLKGRDTGEQALSVAAGHRFQFLVWTDRYVAFNLKDAATRKWNIQRLMDDLDGLQGLFLDAHGPDFPTVIGIANGQTKITGGGGIVEYGGRAPTDPLLIQEYHKDMVTWLTELAASARAKGKFILVNLASYMLNPLAKQQQLAANGTGTEFMHQPLAWAGWYQYAEYLDFTKQVVDGGGVIDAEGHWCYTGNLERGRWNLWRLAAYYQIKEPAGSSGKVYLNLSLCSNSNLRPSEDLQEWLPAYQVDVGQPLNQTTLFQEGKAGTSTSDGRQCDYKIYGRDYTKALVLVRPKDFWDCIDFGDGAAATVSLPSSMRLLRSDGTVGEPTNRLRLKNAEAAILLK